MEVNNNNWWVKVGDQYKNVVKSFASKQILSTTLFLATYDELCKLMTLLYPTINNYRNTPVKDHVTVANNVTWSVIVNGQYRRVTKSLTCKQIALLALFLAAFDVVQTGTEQNSLVLIHHAIHLSDVQVITTC